MIRKKENKIFISASDWIHSASIVGLIQYLKFHNKNFEIKEMEIAGIFDEFLIFDRQAITEKEYLQFVEAFYQIKDTEKYDSVKDFFLKKEHLYSNYCNKKYFLKEEENAPCRVKGYYFDAARKDKSTNWGFEKGVDYQDSRMFDFLPFAFLGNNHETLFLNNNFYLKTLEKMYLDFKNEPGGTAFEKIINLIQHNKLNHSVELIYKDKRNKYFESYFLHDSMIKIFRIVELEKVNHILRMSETEYVNVLKEIFFNVLHQENLNELLDRLIALYSKYPNAILHDTIDEMIKLNIEIKKTAF